MGHVGPTGSDYQRERGQAARHVDPHPGIPQRTARPLAAGADCRRSSLPCSLLRFSPPSLAAAFLWLPIEHVTIVYLIPVIVAALRWGAIPALFAGISGIGAAAFFFYAPYYDFRVHSPAQIADIVLFMTVATITGRVAVAVRQAKIRAQAESLRDALIGSVSHELRTPLASIVGSASVLAQIASDRSG